MGCVCGLLLLSLCQVLALFLFQIHLDCRNPHQEKASRHLLVSQALSFAEGLYALTGVSQHCN